MPAVKGNQNKRLTGLVCLAITAGVLIITLSPVARAVDKTPVKYRLRANRSDPSFIDVGLTFRLDQGERAVLSTEGSRATFQLVSRPKPEYQVESLASTFGGWVVTANVTGYISFEYRVGFSKEKPPVSAGEAPVGDALPLPRVCPDIKVLRGSDVFICPREQEGSALISDTYRVEFDIEKGEKTLAPWNRKDGVFLVTGSTDLLQNYLAWGRMVTMNTRAAGIDFTVGLSGEYMRMSSARREQYCKRLGVLLGETEDALGPRNDLTRLSVLICNAKEYGIGVPQAATAKQSVVIFDDGRMLSGAASVAAARGFLELWNRWQLVPSRRGEAAWFQEGMPTYDGYRVAVEAGLLSPQAAYRDLAGIYLDYVTNPRAASVSLANGPAPSLQAAKGAVVCASMDQRLRDESGGGKDFDWLLGRMAEKFDHFKGRDYSLDDIEGLLEDATGKSWNRFFSRRIQGKGFLLTSDFSSTDLFGNDSGGATGKELETKSSSRTWLFLLVAVAVIIMVPIVFSAYVRRSVNLDLSMPRILPEDDDVESDGTDEGGENDGSG